MHKRNAIDIFFAKESHHPSPGARSNRGLDTVLLTFNEFGEQRWLDSYQIRDLRTAENYHFVHELPLDRRRLNQHHTIFSDTDGSDYIYGSWQNLQIANSRERVEMAFLFSMNDAAEELGGISPWTL